MAVPKHQLEIQGHFQNCFLVSIWYKVRYTLQSSNCIFQTNSQVFRYCDVIRWPMSFVDRCSITHLNLQKNKLYWLFILFWSACVTLRSLPSAILPSDKFSSLQTLSVETGQLGPNLLTQIFLLLTRTLSRWSWQVLGSWNLDVRKCLSSSKNFFFWVDFFCWF